MKRRRQQVGPLRHRLEQQHRRLVRLVTVYGDGVAGHAQVAAAPVVVDVVAAWWEAQIGQADGGLGRVVVPVDHPRHPPAPPLPLHRQEKQTRHLVLEEIQRAGGDARGRQRLAQILEPPRSDGRQVVGIERHPAQQRHQRRQRAHLVQHQVHIRPSLAHQQAVGVTGPQPAVEGRTRQAVAQRVLGRGHREVVTPDGVPIGVHVRSHPHPVHQPHARPQRRAAAQQESIVADGSPDRFQTPPQGLSAGGSGVVAAAGERGGEDKINLEEFHPPLGPHAPEGLPQPGQHLGVGAVQRVAIHPPVDPAHHRLPGLVPQEPAGVFDEETGGGGRTEGGSPDAGGATSGANGRRHRFHPLGELLRIQREPVADSDLVAVVEQNEVERKFVPGDGGDVIQHVLGGVFAVKVVPGAPTGRRGRRHPRLHLAPGALSPALQQRDRIAPSAHPQPLGAQRLARM